MPIGDPWDGFFYPTLTLMIDSYYLKQMKTAETQIWSARKMSPWHSSINPFHAKPRYESRYVISNDVAF